HKTLLCSPSRRKIAKKFKSKLKWCCSVCSIGQQCTRIDKIHQVSEQDLTDLLKPPPQSQEQDTDSDETLPPSPS
ncbi:hypothetical protein Nmel_007514, partial [Mimus melanotis]